VTTYNHMSGFGRGIVEGVHVVQGQTIGYLGDTGLATGPHLHYEVIINGSFVDPMAIKLARTREFDGKMLAAFKRERERIDQLMAQSPSAAAMAAEKPASAPVASTAELQPSATASAPPAPAPNPNAARTSPGSKPLSRSSATDAD
jgi:pyruvate/2-oxoglutarate dehydrogenase complex dihydrolipoamide acyltransferase (E2) component